MSCSIGCGNGSYSEDLKYNAWYPNNEIGKKSKFTYTILIDQSMMNIAKEKSSECLAIRLARVEKKEDTCKIKISNITIKWK